MMNQTIKFDHRLWGDTIAALHSKMGKYLAPLLSCNEGQVIHWQEVGLIRFSRPLGPDMDQFLTVCRMVGLSPSEFFVVDIRISSEEEGIPWD